MQVFVLGYIRPRGIGGANGEALSAAILWQRNGIDVTWIPTWGEPAEAERSVIDSYGMKTVVASQRNLLDVPGLIGSWVVAFCNDRVQPQLMERLQQRGCKVCIVPCMCGWRGGWSAQLAQKLDAVVCQSNFQRDRMRATFAHLIRGAIDWENITFNPRPHGEQEPFVVGRMTRPTAGKWSECYWKVCSHVQNAKILTMGMTAEQQRKCGRKPPNATCLDAGAMLGPEFMSQLHCYLNVQDIPENWPRVGLEAMAQGVPLIVENRGGWAEMVTDGVNGLLYDPRKPEQAGHLAAELANDEPRRVALIRSARQHLETVLAKPSDIWDGWRKVFEAWQ